MKAVARQSIMVPALMIGAWLAFRVSAHLGGPAHQGLPMQAQANPQASIGLTVDSEPPIPMSQTYWRSDWPTGELDAGVQPKKLMVAKHSPDFPRDRAQQPKAASSRFVRLATASKAAHLPVLTNTIGRDEETVTTLSQVKKAPIVSQVIAYQSAEPQLDVGGRRIEGAAWAFFRSSGSTVTSAGNAPTLGGPQVGARLTRQIARTNHFSFGATLRASAPIGEAGGKEASAGVSVGLTRAPGVRFFLERRLPLDKHAQPSWSALASYGTETSFGNGQIKARFYGEAGATQRRRTNPFAYARLQVTKPLSPQVEFGIETVADAQRGANRLDVGPVVTLQPETGANLTLSAAWRLRIAGNAMPKSGPAITVSTSF